MPGSRPSPDAPVTLLASVPRVTSGDRPYPNDGSIRVSCVTCGHAEPIHSDYGNRRCVYTGCDCNSFVAGRRT